MELTKSQKLKAAELRILEEFDRICKKNNIKYSLGYGTLLGAIRHKGFIPWDDDIDIMMFLDDYLKFEKIANSELKEEFYFQTRNINPCNYVFWNRLGLKNTTSIDLKYKDIKADWGICIDIFPIIPISDKKLIRKIEMIIIRIYTILSLKYLNKFTYKQKVSLKEKIIKTINIIIPDNINTFLSNKILKYFMRHINKPTKKCLECYAYSDVGYYETNWFNSYERIEFENKKFMSIKNWDDFLKVQYGDYMKPPKDKTNHSDNPSVLIDFENSYRKYMNDKTTK